MLFDDINEVRVMGNLTQDPELKFTPSGTAVMNFSVATNRSYKQGEEWKEEVTYHNVVVWANLAQQLSTRAKKGTRVMVDGRLQTRTWDGTDGKKNYRTEIVASNVLLIDRYNKGEGAGSNSGGGSNNGSNNSQDFAGMQSASSLNNSNNQEDVSIDPDDLPF